MARAAAAAPLVWRDLGRVPYDEALALQRSLARDRREGRLEDDVLLLLEHPPVLTHGRSAAGVHLLLDAAALEARGVPLVEIERGGDVTYHGPGQLVGYPILDLNRYRRDLHWYLRRLEDVLIDSLASLGIEAARAEGLTGVWVGEGIAEAGPGDLPDSAESAASQRDLVASGAIRKIASIGIHASRWITSHGFALNHTRESLEGFDWIVPCGIRDVTVTSIESEGADVTPGELRELVAGRFAAVFGAELRRDAPDPAHTPHNGG